MPPTAQSLADIQTSLQNISAGISNLSPTEKAKFENSDSAKQLAGGLTSLSGTVTSEQGRRTIQTVRNEDKKTSGNSINDAYSKLFQEFQKKKSELAETQKQLQSTQSTLSIADQQKQQVEDEAAEALLNNKKSSETTPTEPADTGVGLEDLAGDDPVMKALLDSANEQRTAITSQLEVLNQQMLDADEDTKFMVRQIENLANQQIQRQEKVNANVVRGAKVAGLSAGIARYSPETHSGIVQDTINEGLSLIRDIELQSAQKKYEAKKDLRDFRYKSYLESQKLITEYADLKNQTIIKMYEQLQSEENRAREQIKFDQQQEERLSSLLAEELIGAPESQIKSAAEANGVEYGLLLGNVRAITPKPEKVGSSKRSTQVIDIDGKKVLVDTQTGEVISDFESGGSAVDFNTYLEIAQDEMQQTISPDSQLYKELMADWESEYGSKKTSTAVSLYQDEIEKALTGELEKKATRKTPQQVVRSIIEKDTKLTREEQQELLDYAQSLI